MDRIVRKSLANREQIVTFLTNQKGKYNLSTTLRFCWYRDWYRDFAWRSGKTSFGPSVHSVHPFLGKTFSPLA